MKFGNPDNPNDLLKLRRIFLVLVAIVVTSALRVSEWALVPDVFWQPVSFFRVLAPLPQGLLLAGHVLFPIFCLLSAFRPGVAISIATWLLGWLLMGYGMNFGKVDHYFSLVAIALFADAVAQVGRRALPRYDWLNTLFKFMAIAITLMYFSSAVRKAVASGSSWFLSNNMQILLLDHGKTAGQWLGCQTILPKVLAAGAFALELLSPLALLSPWLAVFFLASWLLMHVSIYVCMGPNFIAHLLTFIFLIPFARRAFSADVFRTSAAACAKPLVLASLIYVALSAWQIVFKLDSWPLSSFPMYESDLSRTGLKHYVLTTEATEISLSDFTPFPAATLERSLRKTVEKEKWPELNLKLEELARRKGIDPARLRLFEKSWSRMENFDPDRPDAVREVPR